MLLAIGVNELGSRFRPVPGAPELHRACLLFGFGERACAPIFKPNQLPPNPWLRLAWARAVSFLESGATSTWPFRAGLVRALSPSNIL